MGLPQLVVRGALHACPYPIPRGVQTTVERWNVRMRGWESLPDIPVPIEFSAGWVASPPPLPPRINTSNAHTPHSYPQCRLDWDGSYSTSLLATTLRRGHATDRPGPFSSETECSICKGQHAGSERGRVTERWWAGRYQPCSRGRHVAMYSHTPPPATSMRRRQCPGFRS